MIGIGMGLVLAGMIPAGGLLFVGGFLVFLIGRFM
jgi:hypothetical protein